MRRCCTRLLTLPALLLTGLIASGCSFWYVERLSVGEFLPQSIPNAVYTHPKSDFVLGSDLLLRESDILIAGSRAIGTVNLDYTLRKVLKLNRSAITFKHKPWYFFKQYDSEYVAGLKRILTPYSYTRDYYLLAIRGVSPNAQDFELELPDISVMGPFVVDFDGDGSDSLVIVHPTSPTEVLIYNDIATTPKAVELPTFMPLQIQVVDLDCDGAAELFIEMLPLTEKDDEFELSVLSGPNTSLQPVSEFWRGKSLGKVASCDLKTIQNFKKPRILEIQEDQLHLVEWNRGDTALVIHDQYGTELEKWNLHGSKGLGYISGWHIYRSCDDFELARPSDLVDCRERRFAVVSQSLTSCGRANAPCGSLLVELFDNGKYEELWRSSASTRISHLLENGDLLLHSGNSLVKLNIFTLEDPSH